MRFARTSTIFALPCAVSVTMPACEPVSEIASWPRSWMAIAASAQETRSPTEISMSSSRGFGPRRHLVGESDEVVGRVAHGREDGDDPLALLARGNDPLRDRLQPFGVGDRSAAELHDERADGARSDVPATAGTAS